MDVSLQWIVLYKVVMSLVTWPGGGLSHVTAVAGSHSDVTDTHGRALYSKDEHESRQRQFEWGSWGEASPCSHTCGAGVRYRKRHCYKSSDHVTYKTSISLCRGRERRYDVCGREACSSEASYLEDSYRLQQCSQQDRKPYRGKYKRWKPYVQGSSTTTFPPCALVCRTEGHPYRLAVQFSSTVRDGTHCLLAGQHEGLCINNKCISIGCDRKLYSTTVLDVCGQCGGDNSTCTQVTNTVHKNISLGYSDVFTIPENARDIKITEMGTSPAVFALRSEHSIYFVNSRLSGNNPTVYRDVGGTLFYYYHPVYERDGREKMLSPGPTNETLHVTMLAPEVYVDISIHYSYILPKNVGRERTTGLEFERAPHTTSGPKFLSDVRYQENLVQSEEYWSPRHTNTINKNSYPPGTNKYSRTTTTDSSSNSSNNKDNSKYRSKPIFDLGFYWQERGSSCSATCSSSGSKQYRLECYDRHHRAVDDKYCEHVDKPQHTDVAACEGNPCPPRWESSTWSKCSVSCGAGSEYRGVRCWRTLAPGMDSTVHDSLCDDQPKPPTVRTCQEVVCAPLWETTAWGECTSQCGAGVQYRDVHCLTGGCDPSTKPEIVRRCRTRQCDNVWVTGEWTECSGGCKSGTRKRSVACQTPDGDTAADTFCDHRQRPLSVEGCARNRAFCPPSWVPQAWGRCSVACGQGVAHRRLVCGHVIRKTFKTLPERSCSHLPSPPKSVSCSEQSCTAKWFTTEWSQCSMSCGDGGVRVRKVNCYINNRPSLTCDYNSKPDVSETCQLPSCNSPPTPTDRPCVDTAKINCALVIQASLCRHWYYRRACCHTCTQQPDSKTTQSQ